MSGMHERHQTIIRAIEDHDPDRGEQLMAIDTEYTKWLEVSRTKTESTRGFKPTKQ
jgi:DNA-binding GntR family transcriptional regulator